MLCKNEGRVGDKCWLVVNLASRCSSEREMFVQRLKWDCFEILWWLLEVWALMRQVFPSGIGSLSHHVVSGSSSQALAGTVAELFIPFLQQEGEIFCLFWGFAKLLLSQADILCGLLFKTNPDSCLCCKIHCTVLLSSPVETMLCLLEARALISFLTPALLPAFCFPCSCASCLYCTDVGTVTS